jgi:Kef-type K+ transport system membrane component KefB
MPFQHLPPDFITALLNFLGLVVAGLIGASSRIADDVTSGRREKVWGKKLVVDITSFCIMILVAAAISEYFGLSSVGGAALAGVMCRAGTPLLDRVLETMISQIFRPRR